MVIRFILCNSKSDKTLHFQICAIHYDLRYFKRSRDGEMGFVTTATYVLFWTFGNNVLV